MSEPIPFPKALAWYSAALFGAAVCALAVTAMREPAPDVAPLVLFGAVVIFSSHRRVRFPNGVHVSPAFMVLMASIVVFHDRGGLFTPTLLGILSALYLPSFTRKTWGWIPFNAGITGIALLAAAAAYDLFPAGTGASPARALLSVVPPALADVGVAWTLLALSYFVEDRRIPREVVGHIGSLFAQVLLFAALGMFLGRLYVQLGATVMALIIVPILIAREMFASYMKIKEAHEETVQVLVRALEAKDRYTAGHAERVAGYARYIGEELNFMPGRLERLRFAALMHDIGKLVVPNQLLNKPGKLTADEFARVRVHESVSVQMLSHIDFLRPIAKVSHSDHTRFDPDDHDHPIEPYIVMIADAYDAMTSTRSYRKALPQDVAFQELRDKSGVQFHPECVEALIRAVEKRGEKHGAGFEEAAHFEHAPHAGLGSAGLGDLLSSESA
jgi:HD superfamily phosphodiesterase